MRSYKNQINNNAYVPCNDFTTPYQKNIVLDQTTIEMIDSTSFL